MPLLASGSPSGIPGFFAGAPAFSFYEQRVAEAQACLAGFVRLERHWWGYGRDGVSARIRLPSWDAAYDWDSVYFGAASRRVRQFWW